jgi:hypothetical protein
VSKKFIKKLMFVVAVVAMIAMLIPMSIPVSAAGTLDPATSHNIVGSIQQFTIPTGTTGTAISFSVSDVYPGTAAKIVAVGGGATTSSPLPGTLAVLTAGGGVGSWVKVQATTMGEAMVMANYATGDPLVSDKKWGKIDSTSITLPQDVVTVWNESAKTFSANTTVTDTVTGTFFNEDPVLHTWPLFEDVAEGAVLNWYLIKDTPAAEAVVAANSGWMLSPDINTAVSGLPRADFAKFVVNNVIDGTTTVTTSSALGTSTVNVTANGGEAVLVIVVPEYPIIGAVTEFPVMLEWTKINFWSPEMEKVPQVRWAGEKIVLEKFFGNGSRPNDLPGSTGQLPWPGTLVRFSLENQSPGSLEGIGPGGNLGNFTNSAQTVWSVVGEDGYARCMLVSEDPGEVDVDLAAYNENILVGGDGDDIAQSIIINQHGFVVYYLKLESITLGDVVGKRAGHDTGLWTPANPWNSALDWEVLNPGTPEPLNVSADTLLRARVKGWFMGSDLSSRAAKTIDADPTVETGNAEGVLDNDPTNDADMVLPQGRWVLPDDWARLAGPDWAEQRIHWDIMDSPFDTVGSPVPPQDAMGLGDYVKPYTSTTGALVAADDVIGPFRPGLEMPTATGYNPNIPTFADPQQKTVVPNGLLDSWDAPMPPAKVTFEITNGVGFFKDAMKTDIYYVMVGTTKVYTSPFYQEMIPAFSQIPAVVNNGGYDWDSWNTTQYGPYPFWEIINRPPGTVASSDSSNYPTKAQVYSDNHGEAMIWLNGDWNLNLSGTNGGADVIFNSEVGTTTAIAMADYPYFRKHPKLVSMPVEKSWMWGGQVLGPDAALLAPMILVAGSDNQSASDRILLDSGFSFPLDPLTEANAQGKSNKHVVWVWATDRDGMQAGVLNTQVQWNLAGAGAQFYSGAAFTGINSLAPNSTMLDFDGNGFLLNTDHPGMRAAGPGIVNGMSWLRKPTAAEAAIFLKFWPTLDPNNFAVSAIDVLTTGDGTVAVTEYLTGPEYGYVGHPIGTIIRETDFNTISSYPLDDQMILGDANLDGAVNMLDITAVERIILRMDQPRVAQADANYNQVIDMGDVIRIEKTYLGLK